MHSSFIVFSVIIAFQQTQTRLLTAFNLFSLCLQLYKQVPSISATYTPTHEVDIMCTLRSMPSAEEWDAQGLDKYGLIAVNAEGKYSSEGAAREWSTVVDISIPPLSFKLVS